MESEESPLPPSVTGGGPSGASSMAATTTFLTSLIYVFTSLLSVVSAVGTFLASLLTALPFILVFLAMTLVMLPWVKYHDNVGEEAEFFMRTQVYPLVA